MNIEKKIREDQSGVDFIADGKIVHSIETKKLSKGMLLTLALFGASTKVGNSYAGNTGPLEEKVTKANEVTTRLYANDWRAATTAGAKVTQLMEALALATGRTIEEAKAVVSNLEKEGLASLKAHASIKQALAQVKAKALQAQADKLAAEAGEPEEGEANLAGMFG